MCRKRLSSPRCRSELIDSAWVVIVLDKNAYKKSFLREHIDSFGITPQMVLEKIQDFNPEKSPAPNDWHPILVKNVAYLINTPVAILFQKSLNGNLVHFQRLVTCITAIHKKGLTNLFENITDPCVLHLL